MFKHTPTKLIAHEVLTIKKLHWLIQARETLVKSVKYQFARILCSRKLSNNIKPRGNGKIKTHCCGNVTKGSVSSFHWSPVNRKKISSHVAVALLFPKIKTKGRKTTGKIPPSRLSSWCIWKQTAIAKKDFSVFVTKMRKLWTGDKNLQVSSFIEMWQSYCTVPRALNIYTFFSTGHLCWPEI